MYLPGEFSDSIFVTEKKKQRLLKFPTKHIRTVSGMLCFFAVALPLRSQQIWPGDISGNGWVDHQDVLYWAYARGQSGAVRPGGSAAFTGQEVDLTDWSGDFPGTERSFAYADCNGDGLVDQEDLEVIKMHYFLSAGNGSGEDQFPVADAAIANQLVLGDNAVLEVTGGSPALVPLFLATQDTQDIEVAMMSFQLNYDTELIAEGQDGELLLSLDLDIEGNEWLEDNFALFLHHHENLGFSDVVLYMNTPGDYVVGEGAVAAFSIVVEEVIFGLQDIDINNPVVLNADFVRPGNTSSQGIVINLVGKPVSSGEPSLPVDAVKVFPNPTRAGILYAQLHGKAASVIERLELFDQTGRILASHKAGGQSTQINISSLPDGLYVLRIVTDAGVIARQIGITR